MIRSDGPQGYLSDSVFFSYKLFPDKIARESDQFIPRKALQPPHSPQPAAATVADCNGPTSPSSDAMATDRFCTLKRTFATMTDLRLPPRADLSRRALAPSTQWCRFRSQEVHLKHRGFHAPRSFTREFQIPRILEYTTQYFSLAYLPRTERLKRQNRHLSRFSFCYPHGTTATPISTWECPNAPSYWNLNLPDLQL